MRLLSISLLLFAVVGSADAKVWSVGPSGADFTQIQPAVQAAADGDVILVAPGVYFETVVIQTKALTLIAAPPLSTVHVRRLEIRSIAAHQRVVVRGLDVRNAFPGIDLADGVHVSACAGAVWLEDCSLEGRNGYAIFNQTFPGEEALEVDTSAAVTAVRCILRGGVGYESFPYPGPAGDGVHVASGSLALWDCAAVGGSGGSQPGDGLVIDQGALMTSGTNATGGTAGAATADGLVLTSAGASVEALDSTFSSVSAPPGTTISTWPAASRSLELLAPVVEGATVTARLHGVPGDQVFLFWSLTGGHAFIDGTQGWYVLGPPMGPFFLTTLADPSGEQFFFAPAPPLVQPALGGFTFLMQPYFLNPGETVAGAPSVFVLLKA